MARNNNPDPQCNRVVQRLGGGRGCNKFDPVLGRNGTKVAPPGDLFNQPPCEMNVIRGKLADHARNYVVLSPEGAVLVPSPGTESSYPRPPQSLEHSTGGPLNLCNVLASTGSNRP